jgi:hypothetical protein
MSRKSGPLLVLHAIYDQNLLVRILVWWLNQYTKPPRSFIPANISNFAFDVQLDRCDSQTRFQFCISEAQERRSIRQRKYTCLKIAFFAPYDPTIAEGRSSVDGRQIMASYPKGIEGVIAWTLILGLMKETQGAASEQHEGPLVSFAGDFPMDRAYGWIIISVLVTACPDGCNWNKPWIYPGLDWLQFRDIVQRNLGTARDQNTVSRQN